MKEKLRSEIDEKYKWDLSVLYSNDSEWEKDYNSLKTEIPKLGNYKGILLKNASTLLEFLKLSYKIDRKIEKLYYYAHLNYDSETMNAKYQVLDGKMSNLFKEVSTITAYVEPELLKSDYSIIEKFYEEEKELKEHKNYFLEVYRYKDHILSEKEELIISKLSKALGTSSDTYEKLTDTDLELGSITDSDGNVVKLTDSNYNRYMSGSDRRVRKEAFETMYKGYSSVINTVASTLEGNIECNCSIANLKKYNNAIEAALYDDNVNVDIYNNLIDTVNEHLDVLFKYYDARKEVLKLDELHLYDIYANLISEEDKDYTFEEAKDIVLEALKPLGEQYVKDASKAFTERWIDVYPTKSKRSGAYSSGGYDTYPYMLLNFEGKINNVSTLAHELGHSMHSYYSKNNNSFQDYQYKIFVAEVASTVNEVLLCKYLLKSTNEKNTKLAILNKLMELFKGTIYRQTMFAEFEKDIYDLVEKEEVLTSETLCNRYYELNKKYFGDNVVVDDDIKYEWSRIPHFYYYFYVYKYATGLSAACYIVNSILSGKEGALEGYLKFLSLGGSMYPLDELKVAGVDMTKKEVVESAISMFNETIEEFVKIYKK